MVQIRASRCYPSFANEAPVCNKFAAMEAIDQLFPTEGNGQERFSSNSCVHLAGRGAVVELEFALPPPPDDDEPPPTVDLVGRPAPEPDVAAWINGQPATIESLRGKVVVVAFCGDDADDIVSMLNEVSARGAQVIAVYPADADDAALKSLVKDLGVACRVARDRVGPRKFKGATHARYTPRQMPTCFVIDPAGVVRYQDIPVDAVEKAVEAILDKSDANGRTEP